MALSISKKQTQDLRVLSVYKIEQTFMISLDI